MNNNVRDIIVAIAMIVISSCSCSEAQSHNTFVFTHVNVVPMNREIVLNDQNVMVEDGHIVGMGLASSTKIPKGAVYLFGCGVSSAIQVHTSDERPEEYSGTRLLGGNMKVACLLFVTSSTVTSLRTCTGNSTR
jgi:hypothetical protein